MSEAVTEKDENTCPSAKNNSAANGKVPFEDMESVLLELTHFEHECTKWTPLEVKIPTTLESYLKQIAKLGSTQFPWTKIKPLFRVKLEQVINDFKCTSPTQDIPSMPNVDPFKFEAVKAKVFEQLDLFVGIPFTLQRLAELITAPHKHYKRTDKFMRALEKNMLVVSTVDPRLATASVACTQAEEAKMLLVNGSEHDVLPSSKSPTPPLSLKSKGSSIDEVASATECDDKMDDIDQKERVTAGETPSTSHDQEIPTPSSLETTTATNDEEKATSSTDDVTDSASEYEVNSEKNLLDSNCVQETPAVGHHQQQQEDKVTIHSATTSAESEDVPTKPDQGEPTSPIDDGGPCDSAELIEKSTSSCKATRELPGLDEQAAPSCPESSCNNLIMEVDSEECTSSSSQTPTST